MCEHLFVITGGPGAGKSTLVAALATEGIAHMPEGGRAIIQDQVRIRGDALPWANRMAFAEHMLCWELRSHREGSAMTGPIICDRGVPDVIGFLVQNRLAVPDPIQRAAELFRYNRTVFLAPFWPEIFAQDTERKQDAAEAKATEEVMREVYASLGYALVPLPLVSVAERAAFVRGYLYASA